MSDLVPSSEIEAIVGVKRHPKVHYGRAVTAERQVYVLHSHECLESGIDLRECTFSAALDRGIDLSKWVGAHNAPMLLGIWEGRLIPIHPAEGDSDV